MYNRRKLHMTFYPLMLGSSMLTVSGCGESTSPEKVRGAVNGPKNALPSKVIIESPSTSIAPKVANLDEIERRANTGNREALDQLYVQASMYKSDAEAMAALKRATVAGAPMASEISAGKLYSQALGTQSSERKALLVKARNIVLNALKFYPDDTALQEQFTKINEKLRA